MKGNHVYVTGAATFGTTGKRPSAAHAVDTGTGQSFVYTLPLKTNPGAGELKAFHQ